MFYTYILQSAKDETFYIGYSTDLKKRLEKHNNAKSGYTATKKPWKLVYSESFSLKSEAIKRERFLKKMKSQAFYRKLISENALNTCPE